MGFVWLQRWVLGASVCFASLGLFVAFAGTSPLFDLYNREIARVFFAGDLPASARGFLAFLYVPLGACIFGKWVLAAWLAAGPLARRERWAHDALTLGLVSWFVVDTIVSIADGALFNVVMINLMPLVMVGVPLVLLRKHMAPASPVPADAPPRSRWLEWSCLAILAAGLAVAFLGATPMFAPYDSQLARVFFDSPELPTAAGCLKAFAFGPTGGTIVGQLMMMWLIVRRRDVRGIVWCEVSLLAWFVVDTTLSLAQGAAFNVLMFNLPTLVVLSPPFAMVHLRAKKEVLARR